MSVSTEKVRGVVLDIAAAIEENKQYLTELDAAIGDGDHGHNMARGFSVAQTKLKESPGSDVGDVLKTVAMALISNVGGSAGPLYGTLFLKASAGAKGLDEIDLKTFADILKAGVSGVMERGKAVLGEKTMLDVLIPIQNVLADAVSKGVEPKAAFESAVAAAKDCVEKTKDIVATKGRAAYLGERGIGHVDPGAMSSCIMFEVILKSLYKGE